MNPQELPQWRLDRLGKATASRVVDVMSSATAAYPNYEAQLLVERMTGVPLDGFCSRDMRRGIEKEPVAREVYQFVTGHTVKLVGFKDHPTIPMTGASPDGEIIDGGKVGGCEIKCPTTANHIAWLTSSRHWDQVPLKYRCQMLWQMECAGYDFVDYIVFDDRMPMGLQICITRYFRGKDPMIDRIRPAVRAFLNGIEKKQLALQNILNSEVSNNGIA